MFVSAGLHDPSEPQQICLRVMCACALYQAEFQSISESEATNKDLQVAGGPDQLGWVS